MSSILSSAIQFFLLITVGVFFRFILMNSSYQEEIAARVEISTPVTSWKRVKEGVYLWERRISPYDGDTFHETPLSLQFYRFILSEMNDWIPIIFVLTDVMTAVMLGMTSYTQLLDCGQWERGRLRKLKKDDAKKLAIDPKKMLNISVAVGAGYMLLPYSILSCAGHSTSVFSNFLVSLLLLAATCNLRVISCGVAALLSYHSLYPIVLIIPTIMIIEQQRVSADESSSDTNSHQVDYSSPSVWVSIVKSATLFILFLGTFMYLSQYVMNGNWNFLSSAYLFLLTVPDLTPNIGLFWYFFTEMFDHFRTFFLCTFQINCFIYSIPLALTLRRNPYALFFFQLILLSLLKPYPSISDLAIYLALIPQWSHLNAFLKQSLVVGCILVTTSVLAPIMWHMWIMMGTANSNFYFGVTLAYNTAQILLVTDYFFAFTKREFYLDRGILLDKDGNLQKLELTSHN